MYIYLEMTATESCVHGHDGPNHAQPSYVLVIFSS